MKLAIMQPYFSPYLGYYALIKHTDHFVIFDTPQFIRHGWIERNRILKPASGWQYIKIPLEKHSQATKIMDIRINKSINWTNTIFAQLAHYKRNAPFYWQVINLLEDCFAIETDSIVELDAHILKKTCRFLGIEFSYTILSQHNIILPTVTAPGDWALLLSKHFGAEQYYNPPSGEPIFDKRKFTKENIMLNFLNLELTTYSQNRDSFEEWLSIIDVLMFNSCESINEMLNKIKIR